VKVRVCLHKAMMVMAANSPRVLIMDISDLLLLPVLKFCRVTIIAGCLRGRPLSPSFQTAEDCFLDTRLRDASIATRCVCH
jgi:hypothetical protein